MNPEAKNPFTLKLKLIGERRLNEFGPAKPWSGFARLRQDIGIFAAADPAPLGRGVLWKVCTLYFGWWGGGASVHEAEASSTCCHLFIAIQRELDSPAHATKKPTNISAEAHPPMGIFRQVV